MKRDIVEKSIQLSKNFFSRISDWDIEKLIISKLKSSNKTKCKKLNFINYKISKLLEFSDSQKYILHRVKYKGLDKKKISI